MSNNDYIVQGFNKLLPVMSHFVTKSLKDHFGPDWWQIAVIGTFNDNQKRDLPTSGSEDDLISRLDIARILLLLDLHWKDVFSNMTSFEPPGLTKDCRSWAIELYKLRNRSAHVGLKDFSKRDTQRAIDTMIRLCECFSTPVAEDLGRIYDEVEGSSASEPRTTDVQTPGTVQQSSTSDPVPVMRQHASGAPVNIDVIDLVDSFEGCIVRKDLTKKIKEGANVPIFVLEYLLGMYCSSDDEDEINEGLVTVKDKLSRLYIRPDEAERVKSNIREAGEGYAIIDKVSVTLDFKKDIYVASFLSLGLTNVPISRDMVVMNPRLLSGGIWCIITFDYSYIGDEKVLNPFKITRLSPIQMPFVDVDHYVDQRQAFTKD